MAKAWHRDEWITQGDAWYFFLHERLTQDVESPIQAVGTMPMGGVSGLGHMLQTRSQIAMPRDVMMTVDICPCLSPHVSIRWQSKGKIVQEHGART